MYTCTQGTHQQHFAPTRLANPFYRGGNMVSPAYFRLGCMQTHRICGMSVFGTTVPHSRPPPLDCSFTDGYHATSDQFTPRGRLVFTFKRARKYLILTPLFVPTLPGFHVFPLSSPLLPPTFSVPPLLLLSLSLRKGSEVGRGDKDNNTPLHVAARSGFGSLVSVLLDLGAPIQVANKSGKSPVDLALHSSIAALLTEP